MNERELLTNSFDDTLRKSFAAQCKGQFFPLLPDSSVELHRIQLTGR